MLRRIEDILGEDLVLHDLLVVINVVEKEVQRLDALLKSGGQMVPFLLRNDARHEVERENPLGAALLAVDGEGDPLLQEREIDRFPLLVEFLRRQLVQTIDQVLIMRAGGAVRFEGFVEEGAAVVLDFHGGVTGF